MDLLCAMDIIHFKMAMRESSSYYEIAFVEGAITKTSEIERIKEIRAQANALVALGTCAVTGGIPVLKNSCDSGEIRRLIYGGKVNDIDLISARPIDAVVDIDYSVRGCPVDKEEFLELVKALLLGIHPRLSTSPVCAECKINENTCFFSKGEFCLGPVTRSGCKAICPSNHTPCYGCRGLVDSPNIDAAKDIIEDYGFTLDEFLEMFWIYNAYTGVN